MVLATLLVLSSPSAVVSMESITRTSDKDVNCKVPIDYGSARITSHFGERDNPFDNGRKFHFGLDIGADEGVKIRSVTDGYVYFARRSKRGGGLQVSMRDPSGLKFKYAHMSKLFVKQGEKVKAGQVIGLVGSTGKTLGAHLHLEVYWNRGRQKEDFLDPRQFVCKYRERLFKKVSRRF